MQSRGRAETAVKLLDMGFNLEDCIEAAKAFGDMKRALAYLQQECPLCYDEKPMSQMITFLSCRDKICKDCLALYLTIRIKEMHIHQIVCPVCSLPDLRDEVAAAVYFNNLSIMMRGLVDPETHDLFEKKLRDRALRKEANFRWCAHCSYGFINDFPNVNKMQCPDCQNFTCFGCKKP
ncbi:E3 ubiquitin- ligase RNF31-like, partial [Paramuricea clavata]